MITARRRLSAAAVLAASAAVFCTTAASAEGHGETIAHRGDAYTTPESTLSAFGSALRQNVDGIEFDVQFTQDGVPVVMHDQKVDRTTDCSGLIRSLTWAQVSACDAGGWFGEAFRGERVPSLDQALTFLAQFPSAAKIFVHVKNPSDAEGAVILNAVRANGLEPRVTVLGSSIRELDTMQRAGAGRLGFVFNDDSGWSTDYPVLVPYNVTLTADLIREAQRRGQQVYTVEDRRYAEATGRALGADGVLVNWVRGGVFGAAAVDDGFAPEWW